MSIALAGTLSTAVSVLSGQSVQAALSGRAKLATPFGKVVLPIDSQTPFKILR